MKPASQTALQMSMPRSLRGGFTLVELLVAMTLVALLTAGGLAAHARANSVWRDQRADQHRHERAQYVFATLEPDLQMAGFFGYAHPRPLAAEAVPATVRGCGPDVIARIDLPLERLRSVPPACLPRAALASDSDLLLVRRASAQLATPRAGRAQVYTRAAADELGTVVWNGASSPGSVERELRDLIVRIYYVARSADGDAGLPALRVKNLTEVAGAPAFIDTEVMPGVESLQVELLPQAAPRAVRITLQVRADAADAGARAARRSVSYTRHFTLRNALPDAP